MQQYDLVIIGAGPGGYVAAIKAAALGLKTAVVEERRVGGTCLNRGCIPAKAMIHASELYREIKDGEQFGIFASDVKYDYKKILEYKEDTINQLVGGVEAIFNARDIDLYQGKGTLRKDHIVEIGETKIEGKNILLAAGSKPIMLPLKGMDMEGVITSDELFKLEERPKSLVIIGGGVIGAEFASVYADLGSKVTILEALPSMLPNMDKEIGRSIKMELKKHGVDIHTKAAVKSVEAGKEERLACVYEEKGKEKTAEGEYVLCAVGRCPNTEGLFGEDIAINMERGRVLVDEMFETNIEGVYAIGDLLFGPQLAHSASAQGVYVAEMLAGEKPSINLEAVPGCVYTNPEIGTVGMTEDIAKEKGIEVNVGKFIMSANGKSLIGREPRGFIKIVADSNTRKVLGCQMMCARATDMIGEFTTAIVNNLTVDEMLLGMRAHPTYNEGVGEALEAVFGEAIHAVPKKKKK